VEAIMNTDRRTILALVAAGRLTAAEAERLLTASSEAQEMLWVVALCAVVCLAQLNTGAGSAHVAQAAGAAVQHAAQHVLTLALNLIGGRP
jgi:hypothetical protein